MCCQKVKLIDLSQSSRMLGSASGDLMLHSLRSCILPASNLIEISMEGIEAVDACFVRNSIASFAKIFCGSIGVIVSDVENVDVLDNLLYGMKAKSVSLVIKNKDDTISIFSNLTTSYISILSFVYSQSEVCTSQVAKKFNLSSANVSAKLKKLHKVGLLHAFKHDAETGGLEYVFSPLMKCGNISYQTLF